MSDPTKEEKVLSVEDIFHASDLELRKVEVPEWGGVVYIRPMNGTEREEFENVLQGQMKGPNKIDTTGLRSLLLSKTLTDKEGILLFEDGEILNKKSALVLDRLFTIAQEMNGIGKEAVEDLQKNS